MKKVHLISAALILPAALFADVNVNLSIGSTHDECEYSAEAEYVDDGEPWFEECENNGASRVSFEYQWSIHGPGHILRYRQVTFRTINNAWAFGPWMVKVNYCHPSCRLHHNHVYYRHASHPSWYRVYNSKKRVYSYEYRQPNYSRHGHYKVYRHEYRPQYSNKNHNQYQSHQSNHRDSHHQNYNKPNRNNHQHNLNNDRSQPNHLQKKAAPRNDGRKSHESGNCQYNSRETQKKGSEGKIVRISGRE